MTSPRFHGLDEEEGVEMSPTSVDTKVLAAVAHPEKKNDRPTGFSAYYNDLRGKRSALTATIELQGMMLRMVQFEPILWKQAFPTELWSNLIHQLRKIRRTLVEMDQAMNRLSDMPDGAQRQLPTDVIVPFRLVNLYVADALKHFMELAVAGKKSMQLPDERIAAVDEAVKAVDRYFMEWVQQQLNLLVLMRNRQLSGNTEPSAAVDSELFGLDWMTLNSLFYSQRRLVTQVIELGHLFRKVLQHDRGKEVHG